MASTAPKRSFTAHPAFRWIVALWFAALLGLGLWVMPSNLHTLAIARTGLTLPPPLEPRIAVAAAGAFLGLLLGLVIAGRAATPAVEVDEWDEWADSAPAEPVEPAAEGFAAPPVLAEEPSESRRRRFLNPREDLADDRIAGPEMFDSIEDADYEAIPEDEPAPATYAPAEPAEEPAIAHPPATIEVDALADLTLPELTARLARALGAQGAALPAAASPTTEVSGHGEAALRDALDKLSRVRGT